MATPRATQTIYSTSALGVDPNRTMAIASVSRFGLTALGDGGVLHLRPQQQEPSGRELVVPQGDWRSELDEYYRNTPALAEGINGYKADALHGIWAQAPYLHNGSVPTLAHLVCAATRPRRFLRGNVHYDEALVGFEWSERPRARYGPDDTMLIKEYRLDRPGQRQHRTHIRGQYGTRRARSRGRSAGDHDGDTRIESQIAAFEFIEDALTFGTAR